MRFRDSCACAIWRVIICDFIDLRSNGIAGISKSACTTTFGMTAPDKVLRMSQFGIIEMTRQRMRPSLKRSIYFDCPHCKGAGWSKRPKA